MTVKELSDQFPPDTEIQATDGIHYFDSIGVIRRAETGAACVSILLSGIVDAATFTTEDLDRFQQQLVDHWKRTGYKRAKGIKTRKPG